MKRAVCPSVLVILAWCPAVSADCGSIPFKPWVSIYEPNQRAVIAFDGREEILLLSTDLRASEPTKVLEVIPLPSEPDVKKGNTTVFSRATELINRKLFPEPDFKGGFGGMGGMGGGVAAPAPPAGEITEHKRIGAHDISVAHVLDGARFVSWAEEYLEKQGVDQPKIPEPLKPVIEEYIADGYDWFVFDVVELGEETDTKDAIQYRFKTPSLYYPLRITRAEVGDTKIRLLVLTPGLVRMPSGFGLHVRLVHRPVDVTRSELQHLDEDLFQLLRSRTNLQLRIWEIEGRLSAFKRDIVTR